MCFFFLFWEGGYILDFSSLSLNELSWLNKLLSFIHLVLVILRPLINQALTKVSQGNAVGLNKLPIIQRIYKT